MPKELFNYSPLDDADGEDIREVARQLREASEPLGESDRRYLADLLGTLSLRLSSAAAD